MTVLLVAYVLCAFGTAIYYYEKREMDLFTCIISSLLITPLLSSFVLHYFMPIRKGKPKYAPNPITYFKMKAGIVLKIGKPKLFLCLKVIGVVVVALVILNPSYSSFKEYAGNLNTSTKKVVCKRVSNYLIYSVYEKHIVHINSNDRWVEQPVGEQYIGFLMNFYPATP